MMNKWTLAAVGAAAVTLAGCATVVATSDADPERAAQQIIRTSFQARGQAQLDRLQQDDVNRACSQAQGAPLPDDRRAAIEAANLKAIQWPADGRFLGDWRQGEKLAQSGRGMTWTDAKGANGGNCYNCHQISKTEISFGTIGPSLYNYGKLRGVSDPASPAAKPIVEYTWGKIWNAKAYNACSSMPRMGHAGVLSAEQVRDLMALLLDPKSPVNQ